MDFNQKRAPQGLRRCRAIVLACFLHFLFSVEAAVPNYEQFDFEVDGAGRKMKSPIVWSDDDATIGCIDISPEGNAVIGGYNSGLFMQYFSSTIDFSSNNLNDTYTWSLSDSMNSGKWFDNCEFSPEPVSILGHRIIIATHLTDPIDMKQYIHLIDPEVPGSRKVEELASFSSPIESADTDEDREDSRRHGNTFAIHQEESSIVLYQAMSSKSDLKVQVRKYVIDSESWEVTSNSLKFDSGTSKAYTRGLLLHGDQLFFAMSVVEENSFSRYLIRYTESNGFHSSATFEALSTSSNPFLAFKADSEDLLSTSEAPRATELLAYSSRLVAVGTQSESVDGSTYNNILYHVWCSSQIHSMMFKWGRYLNPHSLEATSEASSYMFGVVDLPLQAVDPWIVKFDVDLDADCSNIEEISPTAWATRITLEIATNYEDSQIAIARYSSVYDAFFLGGRVSRLAYSKDSAAGFIDGYTISHLSGLGSSTLEQLDRQVSFQEVSIQVFPGQSTTLNHNAERFGLSEDNDPPTVVEVDACFNSITLKASSWMASKSFSSLKSYFVGDTENSFPISDHFESSDPVNCPITSCSTLKTDGNYPVQETYSSFSITEDPETSELSGQVQTSSIFYYREISLLCGNAVSKVFSEEFDLNVREYCDVIQLKKTASAANLAHTMVLEVYQNLDGERSKLEGSPEVEPWEINLREMVEVEHQATKVRECSITHFTISTVHINDSSSDSLTISKKNQLTKIEGDNLIAIPPPLEDPLNLEAIRFVVKAHFEFGDGKEIEIGKLSFDEKITLEESKPPYFTEQIVPLTFTFDFYMKNETNPNQRTEPFANEIMTVTPPAEIQEYDLEVYPVPSDADDNGDYVTLTAIIPPLVQGAVSLNSSARQVEFNLSAFTQFHVVNFTEFEIVYELRDTRGEVTTVPQSITLKPRLVYNTTTFTSTEEGVVADIAAFLLAQGEMKEGGESLVSSSWGNATNSTSSVAQNETTDLNRSNNTNGTEIEGDGISDGSKDSGVDGAHGAGKQSDSSLKDQDESRSSTGVLGGVGQIFPGVAISPQEVLIWEGEDDNPPQLELEKKYLPLRSSLASISTLGMVTVEFNQEIQADLFEVASLDESALFFEIVPGDYEKSPYFDITKLSFFWEAVGFDSGQNQLTFQVNFTEAMFVSPEVELDELVIRVRNPNLFKSVDFDRRLSYMSRTMWSPVPKQMPNTEGSRRYDQGTTTTAESMSAATIFTFCLNLFSRGALKEMLGTILSLQIIINLFLLTFTFPANSSNFVSKLKPIVSFNIMKSITALTTDFFPLDTDKQAEYRREILASVQSIGVKTHNAIPNLGNMFHMLAYFFWMVVLLGFLKFQGIASLAWGRKYTAIKNQVYCGLLLKFLISGFIPISMAIYFQFRHPLFTTWGERLGFAAGLIFFALEHVLFPLLLVAALYFPQSWLEEPRFKTKWGQLYTRARYDTLGRRAYLQVFILRRFFMLYVGLRMFAQPSIQLLAINASNILVIIYVGQTEPLKTKLDRSLELFNEAMVALVTYNLFMFTDALPDLGAQFLIGWAFVYLLGLMLVGNSFFVVKSTLRKAFLIMLKRVRQVEARIRKAEQDYAGQLNKLREIQSQLTIATMKQETNRQDEVLVPVEGQRSPKKAKARRRLKSGVPPLNLSIIKEEDPYMDLENEFQPDLHRSANAFLGRGNRQGGLMSESPLKKLQTLKISKLPPSIAMNAPRSSSPVRKKKSLFTFSAKTASISSYVGQSKVSEGVSTTAPLEGLTPLPPPVKSSLKRKGSFSIIDIRRLKRKPTQLEEELAEKMKAARETHWP